MTLIGVQEMQLGDVVRMHHEDALPWSTCVVIEKQDDYVMLWRPYGHISDFSYSRKVITYVGIETYKVDKYSSLKYVLLERKTLK